MVGQGFGGEPDHAYNLFGSKSRILAGLLNGSAETILSDYDRAVPDDPFDHLFSFTRLIVQLYQDDVEFYRAVFRGLLFSDEPISGLSMVWRCTEVRQKGIEAARERGLLETGIRSSRIAAQVTFHYCGTLTLWTENTIDHEGWGWYVLHGPCLCLMTVATRKGHEKLVPMREDIERHIDNMGDVFRKHR